MIFASRVFIKTLYNAWLTRNTADCADDSFQTRLPHPTTLIDIQGCCIVGTVGKRCRPFGTGTDKRSTSGAGEVLGLKRTIAILGVKEMMITFLCYCAIEQTTSLWAVSYIVFEKEIALDKAAGLGAIFFLGITVGRFLSGFLTAKYSDKQMVRIGNVILAAGIFTLFLPLGNIGAIAGLFPEYNCLFLQVYHFNV